MFKNSVIDIAKMLVFKAKYEYLHLIILYLIFMKLLFFSFMIKFKNNRSIKREM